MPCFRVGLAACPFIGRMTWRRWRQLAPPSCFDNGAYSEWQAALARGEEWFIREDWTPFYQWVERRLFLPGRWAVIPDAPGAPSQLNDALLSEWPFGDRGAPLWHMNAPLERLGRLCERYSRVCLGWVGEFDPETKKIRKDEKTVGCPAYRRRMDEVGVFLGNRWPALHMMRGTAVAFDYPFHSADSSSLAQNGHRHDWKDNQHDAFSSAPPVKWSGRNGYANRLERRHDPDWRIWQILGNP